VRFEWPWALAGLIAVPLLIGLYLLLLRRRRRSAVRYASLALIREAQPGRSWWRRHLPFALLLGVVCALVVAFARPETTVSVERGQTTIMLALDVSRSMCAVDVDPNRMVVAQDAAERFVREQPSGTRIGLVAFAGSAQLVVPPTTDTDRLLEGIETLTTSVGTTIGNALLTSIDALSEVNPSIAPSTLDLSGGAPSGGGYQPDIIVLLTDGANTRGVDPVVAAGQAAERRVRVYTIGFGTTDPVALVCTPEQLGGETPFPGGPPGGVAGPGAPGGPTIPPQYLLIDETTLREVAETTGGEYYRAEDAGELVEVFRTLPSRVAAQDEPREVTYWFVMVGAALLVAAVALALRWNRVP
jgi:Ca-activated chloride channel family protein